jgi:hypothetical protein
VHHDLHEESQYEVTPQELWHFSRLWELLDGCSNLLSNAKDLESCMVLTYNQGTGIPASIIICALYPRNEVSKKGL